MMKIFHEKNNLLTIFSILNVERKANLFAHTWRIQNNVFLSALS